MSPLGLARAASPPHSALPFTREGLLEFLRELALDGRMNEGTAAVHATAVRKMLPSVSEWQHSRLDELDEEALFAALLAREGAASRATLETYRSTYARAVALFARWRTVPREARPARLLARRRPKSRAGAPRLAEHLLPLPGGRSARLCVPPDLSSPEARRLAGFLQALAAANAGARSP